MKKLLSIVLIFAMAIMLVACSGEKDASSSSDKNYNVTYNGDTFVLNEEGVLVRTMSGQANVQEPTSYDPWDSDALDASADAESQAKEDNGGEDVPETDPVEDDDDIVEDKVFNNISIISADDGFYLRSKEGKTISKTYDVLVDNYSGYSVIKHQPEKFIAADSNGIYILDTEGNEKSKVELQGVSYIKAYGNYFVYNLVGTNVNTACGVMDMKLKVLVEPSRYFDITPYFIYSNGETAEDNDVLVAKYKDTYGGEVIDFIDKEGEIIIDSALAFAFVDTEKVAILRGATVGFMNFKGEWLTKNPI